MKIILRNIHHF